MRRTLTKKDVEVLKSNAYQIDLLFDYPINCGAKSQCNILFNDVYKFRPCNIRIRPPAHLEN